MNDDKTVRTTEERYINGYNDGYLLSRFDPDIMQKVMQGRSIADNPYFEGMAAGQKAQAREMFQENLKQSRTIRENPNRLRPR